MTPVHKMRMKIPIQKSISPFSKGGEGGFHGSPLDGALCPLRNISWFPIAKGWRRGGKHRRAQKTKFDLRYPV